jgi:hypothetical protein
MGEKEFILNMLNEALKMEEMNNRFDSYPDNEYNKIKRAIEWVNTVEQKSFSNGYSAANSDVDEVAAGFPGDREYYWDV